MSEWSARKCECSEEDACAFAVERDKALAQLAELREAAAPFAAYFHESMLRNDRWYVAVRSMLPSEPGYEPGGDIGLRPVDFQRITAVLARQQLVDSPSGLGRGSGKTGL
jgi:hypothetical protein